MTENEYMYRTICMYGLIHCAVHYEYYEVTGAFTMVMFKCKYVRPRAVLGMGSIDHIEPCGKVPSLTNIGFGTGTTVPLSKTMPCSFTSKSSGCAWKHASVNSLSAGHRRYL